MYVSYRYFLKLAQLGELLEYEFTGQQLLNHTPVACNPPPPHNTPYTQ